MSQTQPGAESPQVFHESATSAAIDGARIALFTANLLVEMDPALSPDLRQAILVNIEQAAHWMDAAREMIGFVSTSAHVVEAKERRLIIPGL